MVGIEPHAGDQLVTACVATALAALVVADVGEVLAQAAVDVAVAQDSVRTLEGGAQKASPVFFYSGSRLKPVLPRFCSSTSSTQDTSRCISVAAGLPRRGTAASWLAA